MVGEMPATMDTGTPDQTKMDIKDEDLDLDLSFVTVRELVQTLQEIKAKNPEKLPPAYNVAMRLLRERMTVSSETPAYMNRHSVLQQQRPSTESFIAQRIPLTTQEKKRRDDQIAEYTQLQTLQIGEWLERQVEGRYHSEGVYDWNQSLAYDPTRPHHVNHALTKIRLDPAMLATARHNQITKSIELRMKDLQVSPCTWPEETAKRQGEDEEDEPEWELSKLPEDFSIAQQLEARATKLLQLQHQLRSQVQDLMLPEIIKYDNVEKFGFRKYRGSYIKEGKMVAKAKEEISKTLTKQRKAKDQEWINSIIQGVIDFKEFHKRARRSTKMVCNSLRKHIDNIDMDSRKKEDTHERDRMRALMDDNEEEYRKLIDEKKNGRLLHLLNQTDEYIKGFTELVRKHRHDQNMADGREDFIESIQEEPEPPSADAPKATADSSYYIIAHAMGEIITTQPAMLSGGTLKSYQMRGLEWMVSLYNNNLNGILADEMGLGKTVQSIALISYIMESKMVLGPYLVVVPLSTLSNWVNEFARWAPAIKILRYKGKKEERKAMQHTVLSTQYNVLLTTYELVIKDKATLGKINWKYLIVDEGHRIKNRESKLTITLAQCYQVEHRLLLTGTPLQNNLTELWGLMNFLLPTIFNSCQSFEEWFNIPFANTSEKQELSQEEQILIIRRLHKVLRPFLLRRLKSEVESELPDKIEAIIKVGMSALQRAIYRSLSTKGIMLSQTKDDVKVTAVRNTLMELRKVCNHPYLCDQVEAALAAKHGALRVDQDLLWRSAGKLELLDRMFKKFLRTGHRVLLFSQMTRLLVILEDYLHSKGIIYHKLDGASKSEDREKMLADFNAPDSPYFVFLLSTHAGGLGLNLQTADTVVIFDSDWNPHQDLQAQDRAHRIGQTSEVRVFRLITVNSVEEKILEAAQKKLQMDAKVIQAGRFDNKTTADERRQLLEDLMQQEMERAGVDDEEDNDPPHTLQEINEIIARSDEEVTLFEQIDRELHEECGGARYRLMRPSEVPDVYSQGDKYDVDEEEALMETYGRGFRERHTVSYTEVSDAKFFKQLKAPNMASESLDTRIEHETIAAEWDDDMTLGSDRDSVAESENNKRAEKSKKKKKKKDKERSKDKANKHFRKLYNSLIYHYSEGRQVCVQFLNRPTVKEYRDYYRIVPEPISLLEIKDKITNKAYTAVDQMRADVELMANNAILYFGDDSTEATDGLSLLQAFNEVYKSILRKHKGHSKHHRHLMPTISTPSTPSVINTSTSIDSGSGNKRKHKKERGTSYSETGVVRPPPVVLRLKRYKKDSDQESAIIVRSNYQSEQSGGDGEEVEEEEDEEEDAYDDQESGQDEDVDVDD